MSLTLVRETGAGLTDANSYATVAEADEYFLAHLYATAWTNAIAANKTAALVWATGLIDAEYKFNGTKSSETQALQWPRRDCPDRDSPSNTWPRTDPLRISSTPGMVPANTLPRDVTRACAETARALVITDRTEEPEGQGVDFEFVGGSQKGYNKDDQRPIVSRVARALLDKYASAAASTTQSALKRV